MSEIEEVAKAAAESAKFGTKALDVSEKMTSFLARLFQSSAEDAVGIISDKLKFKRWQRQIRIADQVQQILDERQAKTTPVPPKFAIPILEAASLEESDELQDLWINLLSNYMDADFSGEKRYTYIDIIKKLSATEAKILEVMYKSFTEKHLTPDKLPNFLVKREEICKVFKLTDDDYYMSIYNLFGTQCMAGGVVAGSIKMGGYPVTSYLGAEQVVLTILGYRLVEAAIVKSDK